jgi:hypothetical protein
MLLYIYILHSNEIDRFIEVISLLCTSNIMEASPRAMEAKPSEDMAVDGRAFNIARTLSWNMLFPAVLGDGDGEGAGEGAGEGKSCIGGIISAALVHRLLLANMVRTKRRRWLGQGVRCAVIALCLVLDASSLDLYCDD